jgi:CheY-like chemotaxis protein
MESAAIAKNINFIRPKVPQILFIDDDPVLLCIVQKALQRQGLQCSTVLSIDELHKAMANGCEPDLVLTDLHIAKESGLTVLEYFRAHHLFFDIPVLLTSSDDAADALSQTHPFNGFLPKKSLHTMLLDVVCRCLTREPVGL